LPARDGVELVLDDLGMLAGGSVRALRSGLVDVADLAGEGSLCLLGAPGAGKTTALRSIVQEIPNVVDAQPSHDAVLAVSLGEITDSGAFLRWVTDPVLARIPAVHAEPHSRLTVLLDGLDECPIPNTGKAIARLLGELLDKADVSALRVLVGCRSAEYPPPKL
jgi:predicted NACHT family NTPase